MTLLAMLAIVPMTLTLIPDRSIDLAAPVVRIGDVAGDGGPVARIVIARLPKRKGDVLLTRRAVAALVRRAVPGVMVAGDTEQGAIAFHAPMTPSPPVLACAIADTAIAAGAQVTSHLVRSQPCHEQGAGHIVAYDPRRRAVTARTSIAAGTNLGPLRFPDPPAVQAGDELTLISRSGPVTVARTVTTLQPGRTGHAVFVRDRAGHVSSIPFVAGDAL